MAITKTSSPHSWIRLSCSLLLVSASLGAGAEEFFPDGVPRTQSQGTPIPSDTTLGGYPIYRGDNDWRLSTTRIFDNNQYGAKDGFVQLLNPSQGNFFVQMDVTVNLKQANVYRTNNVCAVGDHLARVDRGRAGSGNASWDDCMTLVAYVATVRDKAITTLQATITNAQSGGRLYRLRLLINPEFLGFPGTSSADWSSDALTRNPERARFVERVTTYAKQIQDAVREAIAYSKPKDAFKNVPSFMDLRFPVASSTGTAPSSQSTTTPSSPIPGNANSKGVEQRLSELKSLFDKALINKDEYEQKRKLIIDGL